MHCFQGRNLPSRDADGSLDPYLVASLCDTQGRNEKNQPKTMVENDTASPQWYETLRMQLWLPPLELAPQLVLEVWDDDTPAPGTGKISKATGAAWGRAVSLSCSSYSKLRWV